MDGTNISKFLISEEYNFRIDISLYAFIHLNFRSFRYANSWIFVCLYRLSCHFKTRYYIFLVLVFKKSRRQRIYNSNNYTSSSNLFRSYRLYKIYPYLFCRILWILFSEVYRRKIQLRPYICSCVILLIRCDIDNRNLFGFRHRYMLLRDVFYISAHCRLACVSAQKDQSAYIR